MPKGYVKQQLIKKRRKIARVSIPDKNKEHKLYENFDNVKPRVAKLSLSFCEVYQHVYKVVFKYFIKPLFIYKYDVIVGKSLRFTTAIFR